MAKTERSGHTTTDHEFIRGWVEERGGWPARVAGTEGRGDDAGLIRIDFPGYSGEGSLERIEWEEWFQKFDDSELAFLHRDLSHGKGDLDRFNKLVRRSGDDNANESRGRSSRASSGNGSTRSRSASSKTASGGSSARSRASSSDGASGTKSSRSRTAASARASSSRAGTTSSTRSRSGGTSTRSTSASARPGLATKRSTSRSNGNGASAAAENSEMRELLKHELGDLLFAEKVFLKATKALAKEAQDATVKARIEEHVRETEGQIERLNDAFRAIGEKPKAEKCPAALGLQEEHDSFKSEEKPSKMLLSAFDLGSGLRVEHYEIAAYRTTIAVATAMGERGCASLLKENLKEEMAMASFLEKNALSVLKEMARA